MLAVAVPSPCAVNDIEMAIRVKQDWLPVAAQAGGDRAHHGVDLNHSLVSS